MLIALQRNFKRQISEPVDLYLSMPTAELWDKVLTAFRETLGKAESAYLTKAKSKSYQLFFLQYLQAYDATKASTVRTLKTKLR